VKAIAVRMEDSILFNSVSNCPSNYTLYSKCASGWGSQRMGTSSTQTICSNGADITATAMLMASLKIENAGKLTNPGNLNSFLTTYQGYVNGDVFVWNTVCQVGVSVRVCLQNISNSVSASTLSKYVANCMPVIAGVPSQSYDYVYVTGAVKGSSDMFEVNDPNTGANKQLSISQMSEFVLYEIVHVQAVHAWQRYLQCNSTYGNRPLGTSSSQSICTAGCAMSATSMALATAGILVNGQTANPGSLNSWLIANNGYADGDLIIWNSTCALTSAGGKRMCTLLETSSMSSSTLTSYVSKGYPVIVNVLQSTHWVLVTGAAIANPNMFFVNDPYFSTAAYNINGISNFVVYHYT